MRDKLTTAAEAARLIEDDMHLGLGAGMEMNPMPVIREVIRNGVKNLTITPVITGGYVSDLLVGAGCVKKVQFPRFDMGEYGTAPNFRRKVESKDLALAETM
jgi:glutaconate CoA-transferase subunit A